MDALPSWSIPGHDSTKFPWRAPGDVDRALPGAAARRLYVPPPLHESCRKGDADDVRARLDAGADVNEKDGGDHTPLHFAAGYGHEAIVTLLLQRGATLEPRDKWGKAPVDWALESKSQECVKLLQAEACARNEGIGRGTAAPLSTLNEFFYGLTDAEMQVKIAEMNDKVAERSAQSKRAPEDSVSREEWNIKLDL